MAVVAPSSPGALEPKSDKSGEDNPPAMSQDPPSLPSPAASAQSTTSAAGESTTSAPENPNPAPTAPPSNAPVVAPRPPSVPSFTPSFRPIGAPHVPQFTPLANPNLANPGYQVPGLQPPGVAAPVHMVHGSGTGASVPPLHPPGVYHHAPGQMQTAPPGSYMHAPNGYMTVPQGPSGIPPPGVPRYPSPYPTMVHPGFPQRPPGAPMGVIPQLSRPPIQGIRGIPPLVAPVVRPAVPIVAPAEKPQTTVYVGKIASTVENEFLESLLRLCGPVKSWKRAENPSDGTFRGFGFCEFESAEGVLRALRLLNKLNMDGQELVLNVNQATREYLERYVDKKTEREKLKESEAKVSEPENGSPSGPEKQEPPKPADESPEANEESENKEKQDNAQKFGIVSEEDRDADRDALERLTNMMQERLKNKPLLPPPPFETASDTAKSNSEAPSKSRDGDSDVDIIKHDAGEDKRDDEMMSETKPPADHDRSEASSSDRTKRRDRSRERDRERDLKRDKERELERYERERERERVRREREREMKIRESERLYKDLVKDWESREREKENQRLREMEREKERARERRREIKDQEIDSDDDDTRKRRHRSSMLEEKRRKRQREKEEDLADRLREEEEIAEAKKRVIEELKRKEESRLSGQENGDKGEVAPEEEMLVEDQPELPAERPEANFSFDGENDSAGEEALRSGDGNDNGNGNGNGNGMLPDLPTASEPKQGSNISSLKLGFGLMASGKRAAVPSVFHQEDDEGVQDKKMRPLVPIDYSTEELQAVQATASGPSANLVAAAEFAKRISVANPKEDRPEPEERSRRSSQRDRSRDDDEHGRTRDVHREKTHERPHRGRDEEDKVRSSENRKLLDAKQLIDMIPKTKEKLFAYEINWDVYDKHELHERMRPWISKKITEFLGEEETTLVDYIVSSTREHVHASQMLELLQSILDDEAEMFVLKMWRMLIFEIKKVETGLALKTK